MKKHYLKDMVEGVTACGLDVYRELRLQASRPDGIMKFLTDDKGKVTCKTCRERSER